jgi:hypothetical protein
MKRDWLAGAQFVDIVDYHGMKVEKWSKKGLQDNFYYSTVNGSIPAGVDMPPDDFIQYIPSTYKEGPIDPSEFTIPSYCNKNQKCPLISICSIV